MDQINDARLCRGELLYLSSSIIPSESANSVHVMKMCAAFARAGYDVTLIAKTKSDIKDFKSFYEEYGVPENFKLGLTKMNHKLFSLIKFYVKLMLALLTTNSNVAIYGRHIFSIFIAALLRKNFIYEVHNYNQKKVFRQIENYILSSTKLKRLNAISLALKQKYVSEYPDKEAIIEVLHDGADDAQSEKKIIRPFGDQKKIVVGYAGSLYPGKGMELIHKLTFAFKQLNFCIVGGNAELVKQWRAKCCMENTILIGHIPPKDVPKYINGFDIVLAPYQKSVTVAGGGDVAQYMSPLKIFEYLSSEKAIVCSNLPVLKEVLTDGETGLMCDPDDLNQWISAISCLVEKQETRLRLARNGRKLYEKGYSWDARALLAIS